MKKYNLSAIMKRAWNLVKAAGMTISSALKKAWEEAKVMKEKFEKYAKVLKEGNLGSSESDYFTFRRWEKGNYRRIYVNDYKRRTVGYINIDTKEIEFYDTKEAKSEMQRFIEKYEF